MRPNALLIALAAAELAAASPLQWFDGLKRQVLSQMNDGASVSIA
jgi:hypothetical protein